MPGNFWKHTKAVIVGLFLTCLQVMKPAFTCLSQKEGLIISNGSEKIKNAHVFYKNSVLKKVKEFYNKKRQSKGWSGVHLLHDNASSHKCEVVKSFWLLKRWKFLTMHLIHLTWVPMTSFYFQGLRKCFLEISIRLEVLLAALFISVSNRYQKKTFYLLFVTGSR